jgi:hypothetical protein
MADTRPNIPIPKGQWVDLYELANIVRGIQISVENVGTCDVYLAVQEDQPEPDHDAYNIVRRKGDPLRNNEGDAGAWAFCNNTNGLLNVSSMAEQGFAPPSASDPSNQEREDATISEQEFRSRMLAKMESMNQELHLLNLRFEEAFETDIDGGDV